MDADKKNRLNELSDEVIGAAYEVSNVLGAGFLEKVYRDALREELRQRGLDAKAEQTLKVQYKGVVVGDYSVDLLVEQELIVELKCVDVIVDDHLAQCLNYLKATGAPLGLMINFQRPRVEVKRVVNEF
jgi:GxxExxY protein